MTHLQAADLLREGAALARGGDLARAAEAFAQAAALAPNAPHAHFNLGNARAGMGALDEAAAAFERALDADPAFLPALNNLGDLRLRQQRPAEALASFERVRALDPGFPHVDHNLGAALQALGRLDEATLAYRRALAHQPDDQHALNNLCVAQLKAGDAAGALASADRFLELAPGSRRAFAYRAAALLELGRRDEAAVLHDHARLLHRERVAPPSGFGSLAAFNAALAAHVMSHPTLAFEPPDKTTYGGHQTGELMVEPKGPFAVLEAAIRAAVPRYMARLRVTLPDHPFVAHLPARWQLATWGVVLRAQGHQGAHFHPDGYVSGVYYAQLPPAVRDAADRAGAIEFGRSRDALGGAAEPLLEVVTPEEGLMLLFPSYLYHRTLPFDAPEPRICVAFDVVPAR